MKDFYITTPIYYVNDVPHLGHAYTSVACDVMARFMRSDGYNVKFTTGTDEHGQKVEKSALVKGITPIDFCDNVSENFREMTDLLGLTNDDFIRTTEERHRQTVERIWKRLVENGQIYLGQYEGWYSVRDEAYYAENELKTLNGKKFAPSGAECEWVVEPSYFFKLSAWKNQLLDWYRDNPGCIQPIGRMNEVMSFVENDLRDLSISRTTFGWGIPVKEDWVDQPFDRPHVVYVWLDALVNYLTTIEYGVNDETFKKFWPNSVHVVGKDILRFHAVYWPAFLMAANIPPPKKIIAHGWWMVDGQKMSKSLGNVISPTELIERYGRDQTRFYLLREMPFGNDGSLSHRSITLRVNSELSNAYGNLVQRVLSMVAKNCNNSVPKVNNLIDVDNRLLNIAYNLPDDVRVEMVNMNFHKALDVIWNVIDEANAYVDRQEPWNLRKTDMNRMSTTLWVLSETIRCVAITTQAFVPEASMKILDQLSIPLDKRQLSNAVESDALKPGTFLPTPYAVFPRLQEV